MAHGHSTLSKPSKTSNIAVLFPKLLKRAGTKIQKGYRKSLRKVPKITLIIEFHRLKDFLFTAVKDTVQEKFVVNFIYRAAAWKEAGLSESLYSREDLGWPEQILHRGHGQERVVHPCSIW